VFEAGEDRPVGQAVRQQYATVREEMYPGALAPTYQGTAPGYQETVPEYQGTVPAQGSAPA